MTTTKISVTVPSAVLADAERIVAQPGESRSALVSRVLAAAVQRALEDRYAEGYRRQPMTPEEDAQLAAAAREGVADVQSEERRRGRGWHRLATR